MQITIYTKPGCVQCTATTRYLDDRGVVYETADVTADASALATVQQLDTPLHPSWSQTASTGQDSSPRNSTRSEPKHEHQHTPPRRYRRRRHTACHVVSSTDTMEVWSGSASSKSRCGVLRRE